jgi:hypothetical protein
MAAAYNDDIEIFRKSHGAGVCERRGRQANVAAVANDCFSIMEVPAIMAGIVPLMDQ